MSRLRLLFNWRFVKYALKRFCGSWDRLIRDFDRSQGSSDRLIYRDDVFVADYRYLKRDPSSVVSSGVRILTPVGPCEKETGVYLRKGAYLGPGVYLEIASGNVISIGEDTTINPNSCLLGDVRIGNHSMLAPDVYISSGNHFATYRPTWLIRDQDRAACEDELYRHHAARPVIIEDDCWIGKGVFIRNGIYIGKGAIVGANSVVTKDVPPYSIQVGAPNRELSKRAVFEPPAAITASKEEHWPYFYSGFKMLLAERTNLVKDGVLMAKGSFRVILRGGTFTRLEVKGNGNHMHKTAYRVECNGVPMGLLEFEPRAFKNILSVPDIWTTMDLSGLPSVLRGYNVLTFVPIASGSPRLSTWTQPMLGIESIWIA